jgi:hypothetical protein
LTLQGGAGVAEKRSASISIDSAAEKFSGNGDHPKTMVSGYVTGGLRPSRLVVIARSAATRQSSPSALLAEVVEGLDLGFAQDAVVDAEVV